jgi:hypothetical protein
MRGGGAVVGSETTLSQGQAPLTGAITEAPETRLATGLALYSVDKMAGSIYIHFGIDEPLAKTIEREGSIVADISIDGTVSGLEILLTDRAILDKMKTN